MRYLTAHLAINNMTASAKRVVPWGPADMEKLYKGQKIATLYMQSWQ